MRDTRKKLAALARALSEAERERLVRLYTRGKLTDDEYDAYSADIDRRKELTEAETARLEDERRYVEYLDQLPRLVEDYLKELPELTDYMPRIREHTLSDEPKSERDSDGHLKPYLVGPGTYRTRTPEEMADLRSEALDERARRYRALYERLNLKAVSYPDGDLEISWFGGGCKVSGGGWSA